MTTKIVIIGMGNIGRRHLQAICNLDIDYLVLCYDIFQGSLDAIEPFCEDNNLTPKGLQITPDFQQVLSAIDASTIVIVATTAKGRADILCDVIARKPKAVISEKPVSQTGGEYDRVLASASEHQVQVYTNFVCHTYDAYRAMLDEVRSAAHGYIVVNFSNIGFACGGIHYIELATWLFDAKTYSIEHSSITSTQDSKRSGFQDFSGRLTFKLNDKHTCTINIMDEPSVDFIEIITDKKIWKLFETSEKQIIIDSNYGVKEEDFKMRFVSQISDFLIKAILSGRDPMIPTIQQAHFAHRILFDMMRRGNIEGLNVT